MTAANFRGRELFAAVAQGGNDPMPAVLFSTVTMTIFGAMIGLLYMLIFMIFGAAIFAAFGATLGAGFAGVGVGMGFVIFISATISGALHGFLGPWVVGGLHHLTLMLMGGVGVGREYSHTVRAHAYASASAWMFTPLLVIPLVNFLALLGIVVFLIINHISAYDEMHRCGGGKAFGALALPFAICCCAYWGLMMFAGVLSGF